MVHILYGTAVGLSSAGSQTWRQGQNGLPEDEEIGDHFGEVLATGDFNCDGRDDLAIGVPGEDFEEPAPTRYAVGVVHVLYGTNNGLSALNNDLWHQDLSGLIGSAEQYDSFGAALSAGDFDADGCDELAIGVPDQEVSGTDFAGVVHILPGYSDGLITHGDMVITHEDLGVTVQYNEGFGEALVSSDFNGDGFADLAIGVPEHDFWGLTPEDCGTVRVLYGSRLSLSTADADIWYQGLLGLSDEPEESDQFGETLAAGDFNGDGYGDLIIGVPYEDVEEDSTTYEDAGLIHVIYGTADGLSGTDSLRLYQDGVLIPDGLEDDERFGFALAAIPRVTTKVLLPIVIR